MSSFFLGGGGGGEGGGLEGERETNLLRDRRKQPTDIFFSSFSSSSPATKRFFFLCQKNGERGNSIFHLLLPSLRFHGHIMADSFIPLCVAGGETDTFYEKNNNQAVSTQRSLVQHQSFATLAEVSWKKKIFVIILLC